MDYIFFAEILFWLWNSRTQRTANIAIWVDVIMPPKMKFQEGNKQDYCWALL